MLPTTMNNKQNTVSSNNFHSRKASVKNNSSLSHIKIKEVEAKKETTKENTRSNSQRQVQMTESQPQVKQRQFIKLNNNNSNSRLISNHSVKTIDSVDKDLSKSASNEKNLRAAKKKKFRPKELRQHIDL